MVSYLEKLRSCGKKICVYGMGDGAEKIIAHLKRHGIDIDGVFASDAFVRGQYFLGMRVLTKAQAEEAYGDFACVTAFALHGKDCGVFRALAKEHELYAPNLPPYGEGCADEAFLEREKGRTAKLRSLWADEDSAKLFDSLLRYNITADIDDLCVCDTAPDGWYVPQAVYIDIGAYDGDTAREFAARCPDYEKIYALEPDPKTFKKLCENTKDMPNIVCINAAAGEREGKVFFSGGRGRGGRVSESGTEITQTTIDSLAIPRVTNIKCDGEGEDVKILCGAVNTVYYRRPSVKCAVYHRAGDILDIPLWLKSQSPGCKLYLRNVESIPAFDVFVYAVN